MPSGTPVRGGLTYREAHLTLELGPVVLHRERFPFRCEGPLKVDADAEIVMFSPQREHSHVIRHMIEKVTG